MFLCCCNLLQVSLISTQCVVLVAILAVITETACDYFVFDEYVLLTGLKAASTSFPFLWGFQNSVVLFCTEFEVITIRRKMIPVSRVIYSCRLPCSPWQCLHFLFNHWGYWMVNVMVLVVKLFLGTVRLYCFIYRHPTAAIVVSRWRGIGRSWLP